MFSQVLLLDDRISSPRSVKNSPTARTISHGASVNCWRAIDPPVDRSAFRRKAPRPLEHEQPVPHDERGDQADHEPRRRDHTTSAIAVAPTMKPGVNDRGTVPERRLLVGAVGGHEVEHPAEHDQQPDPQPSIAPEHDREAGQGEGEHRRPDERAVVRAEQHAE